jgi:hypothetical protein
MEQGEFDLKGTSKNPITKKHISVLRNNVYTELLEENISIMMS